MKMKRYILLILTAVTLIQARPEIINPIRTTKSSFAIIIDRTSYSKTESAVLTYRDAVETDGLSTYIILMEKDSPNELRQTIIDLKSRDPKLEGVVFVGDIPIPMIRDAQHLASAFKMDQERYPFKRSSIPSDRFYDDFDLEFKFLEQDTSNTLLYYYSLTAESPQKIEREIYSARIRPPFTGEEKYVRLEKYLNRVADQKQQVNMIDNLMRYSGHGYNSESLSSWEAEALTLREQFPQLFVPGGTFTSLEHSMADDMKTRIINELHKPELDMVIFHAHGGVEAQYFSGYPEASSIDQNVDAIKMFVRSKLRQAQRRKQSVEDAKTYYMENYGLPEAWFEGTFDDSVIVADSIYSANLDMDISDVSLFEPGAELIIFDECFNGSFQKDRYIAGEYVFGRGSVIAGIANSVNVKQDLWADEGLGLLNYNVRIGQWHQDRNYLENHIIGDPTFRFNNPAQKDWSLILHGKRDNLRFWQKMLKSEDVSIRALAINKTAGLQQTGIEELMLNMYKTDPSFLVRLAVLKELAATRSVQFEEILFSSVNDPYELIRRFSVQWMGVVGREDYLPVLVDAVIFDPSNRVTYTAKSAIEKIAPDKVYPYFEKAIQQLPELTANSELLTRMEQSFQRSTARLREEVIPELTTDTLKLKTRIGSARMLRNYQFQEALPVLLSVMLDESEDAQLRVVGIEAAGWYTFSHTRKDILEACETLLNRSETPADVKHEALKTKKRIIVGYNDPVNP